MVSNTSITDLMGLSLLRFHDVVEAISAVLEARKRKR